MNSVSRSLRAAAAASMLCAGLSSAGCGGGGGGATPAAPASNPSSATVQAVQLVSGSEIALSLFDLTMSTGVDVGTQTPTGVLPNSPVLTDSNGNATFTELPPSGQLCVSGRKSGEFEYHCAQPFPATYVLQF